MKKILLVLLPCLAVIAYFLWDSRQAHYKPIENTKPSMHKVEVTGEVVDAWCYSSQTMGPGKGVGHRACARACIGGGVTIGILEDGTNDLYIAAKYKGFKGCKELLLPYVGDKVTVEGWVGERGGCRLMRIDTVKRLSGPDDILLKYGSPESGTESDKSQQVEKTEQVEKTQQAEKTQHDDKTQQVDKSQHEEKTRQQDKSENSSNSPESNKIPDSEQQ